MTGPRPDHLVDRLPLRHGLVALVVRRCPAHPLDHVTDDGCCLACSIDAAPYGAGS